jgi:hypothetical protein
MASPLKKNVGWFVEVPRELRDQFDKLYPGRRNKKILTLTAIKCAIERNPKSLFNLFKEQPDALATRPIDVQGDSTVPAGRSQDGKEHRDDGSQPDATVQ